MHSMLHLLRRMGHYLLKMWAPGSMAIRYEG